MPAPQRSADAIHIIERRQFEGEDPLWHPSSWRIVTLSTGQSAKVGVMGGGARGRRLAWLDDWEQRVIDKARASGV